MKFLHTGDLHIGKRIYETDLNRDQKNMLEQIFLIAEEEKVDAVLIAGDVYDRSVPATEAVGLLDDFLTGFARIGMPVVMISGNHDSAERVSFADKILEKQGLYIAGSYEEKLRRVEFEDPYGTVCVVCMPFIKPAQAGGRNCTEAVANILEKEQIDFADGKRYVLLAHYFVTGENGQMPELANSESGVDVGGIDNVPADLLQGFSYVALGHIHKSQHVGNGPIYYAGAPMKYDFSEANTTKTVNIVSLAGDGSIQIKKRQIFPYHDMRCIKGRLQDLMQEQIVQADGTSSLDYIQATLTDREELIDPIGTLRSVYPNTLQILIEKNYSAEEENYESRLQGKLKNIQELFGDFYEMLTGEPLEDKQRMLVEEVAKLAEEEWK